MRDKSKKFLGGWGGLRGLMSSIGSMGSKSNAAVGIITNRIKR